MDNRKHKQMLWPFLLIVMALVGGGGCSDDGVDWKEGIEGSVFKDFETILYVGEIPETVDKDNSVYFYYPNKENPPSYKEYENTGYFRYSIPFLALYMDGHIYSLVDEKGIMTKFLEEKHISPNGLPIKLSGVIIQDNGFTFDTHYCFFKITNIKPNGK